MNNYEFDEFENPINALVKWYNPEKGYGFVVSDQLPDPHTNIDIFLHFSALEYAGIKLIQSNDEITCKVARGPKGLQVIEILQIKFGPKEKFMAHEFFEEKNVAQGPETYELYGEVKWFNPLKGFGFIFPDEDGPDVFFHVSVLNEAGYDRIEPGARVSMKVFNTKMGKEAKELRVIQ